MNWIKYRIFLFSNIIEGYHTKWKFLTKFRYIWQLFSDKNPSNGGLDRKKPKSDSGFQNDNSDSFLHGTAKRYNILEL